jgi:hypothetical protein
MSHTDDQTPSTERQQDGSLWTSLFHGWILHYFLPGLIVLAVAMWGLLEKQKADERKLEKDIEETRQAIRERGCGEAARLLFPAEYNKYLRRKQQREKQEAASEQSAPARRSAINRDPPSAAPWSPAPRKRARGCRVPVRHVVPTAAASPALHSLPRNSKRAA